ncbi:unnamed protein product [Vitrella brassicaformis CCMP3155]|uniref:Kinesin-like protein n=3 Tax=Vitrella brassicaformis TaxID=1169539 RepID=A0A0G4ED83_VITBC|nr:unnamed protein product [Vitrella brassicaformis CCMP3155]|eukprot:CEL93301.1 unnamed protein product [Vitrella brassicaformis CCMP3155]
MVKAQIQIYARLRPRTSRHVARYKVCDSGSPSNGSGACSPAASLTFEIPPASTASNQASLSFSFHGVFDESANQSSVFERVAYPVLLSCIEGYNGTIFCYGQTASGKTHTMTGDASFDNRGLIPRCLEALFDELKNRQQNTLYSVSVSFIEIYNENCYDLLAEGQGQVPIEQWPKINCFEDETANLRLRGLTLREVGGTREGLDVLFLGIANRMVSTTPMNEASSRSHCIFTIAIEGRSRDNEHVVRYSKLHLVDLAGSERVHKMGLGGAMLNEAKYINLSLHFLEQVIVALQDKAKGSRSHIPYRNSMLTSILRDSLGGNCKTNVIANMSVDMSCLEETISTARFAQRCSALSNDVRINETVDLRRLVDRLMQENQDLKAENAYLRARAEDPNFNTISNTDADKDNHTQPSNNQKPTQPPVSSSEAAPIPPPARAADDDHPAPIPSPSTTTRNSPPCETFYRVPSPMLNNDDTLPPKVNSTAAARDGDGSPAVPEGNGGNGDGDSPASFEGLLGEERRGAQRPHTHRRERGGKRRGEKIWRLSDVLDRVERSGHKETILEKLLSDRGGTGRGGLNGLGMDFEFSCVGDLAVVIQSLLGEIERLKGGQGPLPRPIAPSPLSHGSHRSTFIPSLARAASGSRLRHRTQDTDTLPGERQDSSRGSRSRLPSTDPKARPASAGKPMMGGTGGSSTANRSGSTDRGGGRPSPLSGGGAGRVADVHPPSYADYCKGGWRDGGGKEGIMTRSDVIAAKVEDSVAEERRALLEWKSQPQPAVDTTAAFQLTAGRAVDHPSTGPHRSPSVGLRKPLLASSSTAQLQGVPPPALASARSGVFQRPPPPSSPMTQRRREPETAEVRQIDLRQSRPFRFGDSTKSTPFAAGKAGGRRADPGDRHGGGFSGGIYDSSPSLPSSSSFLRVPAGGWRDG